MELFLSYTPSNENRESMFKVIDEAKKHAGGEPHRYETLHSTLAYLGEIGEERLPELREVVRTVGSRHKAIPVRGKKAVVSHDTAVYDAWGLLYLWEENDQLSDLYADLDHELAVHGFWEEGKFGYFPHSTLYMRYFPNPGEEEWTPEAPVLEDRFDQIVLYQVTVIDGHVAYYPLFVQRLQ